MTRTQRFILVCLGVLCLGLIGTGAFLALKWRAPARVEPVTPLPSPAPYGRVLDPPLPSDPTFSPPAPIPPSPSPTPYGRALDPPLPPDPTLLPDTTCVITATGGLASEIYVFVMAMPGQAMPGPDSNGMRVPTDAQMASWEALIQAVMRGEIPAACQIIHSQGFPYHLVHFTDVRNENERYWLLREDAPVSMGWGTYVLRVVEGSQVSTEQLPLIIEVPHPVADWRTDPEGVEIFRQSQARALLIAGTHRCANRDFSTCRGQTMACGQLEPYRTSDAAHTTQSMFQAAHRALARCDGTTIVLQLHANSLANCADLFISNGTLFPGTHSRALYEAASSTCGGLTVDIADGVGLPGLEECAFTSGASAQAIYSNTCAADPAVDACADPPLRIAGAEQFISFEQSGDLTNDYQCLVDAIQKVWGATP